MKEFRPSGDFVSSVMEGVREYERGQRACVPFTQRLFASRLFRYTMSCGSLFVGIFIVPVACL
jgi:hypothetical protein